MEREYQIYCIRGWVPVMAGSAAEALRKIVQAGGWERKSTTLGVKVSSTGEIIHFPVINGEIQYDKPEYPERTNKWNQT